MTRTEKWKYKRLKLECDRDILANALLNTSEKLMELHSDVHKRAFEQMFEDSMEHFNRMVNL